MVQIYHSTILLKHGVIFSPSWGVEVREKGDMDLDRGGVTMESLAPDSSQEVC